MPKLLYFLRTAPCFLYLDLLERFDEVLCDAIERLCNVSLTDFSRKQLSLPCSLGGLGLPLQMSLHLLRSALPLVVVAC